MVNKWSGTQFRNGNQIEYCLSMQKAIQKGYCAYAKVGKSKPKSKGQLPETPRSKRGENIYEDLMGELDADQSEYINRLCKKNEERMRKNHCEYPSQPIQQSFKDVANILNSCPPKTVKKHTKRQSSAKISKENISSASSLNVSYREGRPRQKESLQRKEEDSVSSQSQQPKQYFINSLDEYIIRLRESQQRVPQGMFQKRKLNNSQSQNERSFRRTVQLVSKSKRPEEQCISKAKYYQLLDKLHEQIYEKQGLIYKLECKEAQGESMKKTIKQMHNEILSLKKQVIFQREQKNKYSQIAEDFVHRLHQTRTKSKQKHYIPHHLKRNSHVPSSNAYSIDFSEHLNRTGNVMHVMRCRDKQQVSTLKKKGMHRYKISEIQVDGNQSFHPSIYNDSY